MEPSEAIAFLRRYNHWRRGGEMDQPHPYQIGQAIDAICDQAERMERELAVWKHDVKQLEAELQTFDETAIVWWCEYQDLKAKAGVDRAEIEQIKATLANPHAVHINMLRGTIQWTPANLRHLLGDSTDDLADQSEIDRELDACVERSARDWRPLPGDPDEPSDANRLQTETNDQAGDTA